MTARIGVIGRAIDRLVGAVLRHPLVTVVGVIGLSVAGMSYTLAPGHLAINTNTSKMISDQLPWRQDFEHYREKFPARDGNIIVVIDGNTPEAAASYARELGEALLAEPEIFPDVFLGRNSEFFVRNGLMYLPLEDLYELSDRLASAQPLLATLATDTSGAAILELLADALARESELPAGTADALTEMITAVDDTLSAAAAGERQPVAWGPLLGSDFGSTMRQILLIRPVEDSRRIPAKTAIDRIHEIRSGFAARYGDTVSVRLTGTPAMEYEELTSIIDSAMVSGIAALVMVIAVLLWFLRSLRLLVISVVTLLAGLCLTATFAAVTVGELNLLSVAFAVLYVGLGVDFILHLLLRLEELLRAGRPLREAMLATAEGVGSSLVICALTTAVGFFAFIPTDFIGISALGLIAGGGMFISLLVSLSLLPALVMLTTPANIAQRLGARAASGLRVPVLPPRLVCTLAGVAVLIVVWFLPPQFDGNPINLRDPEAESVQTLHDLATDSEAPIYSLAVVVPDATAAAAVAGQLAVLETVYQVHTVDTYVPEDQAEKLGEVDFLALEFGATLASVEQQAAAPERVLAAVGELVTELAGRASLEQAHASLLAAARRWLARINALPGTEQAAAVGALDSDISGSLVAELDRLRDGLYPSAITRSDLPAGLRDRWISATGDELVEVVPKENLNDQDAAARFVAEVRAVAPSATGLPVVYEKAAETVTRAFAQALIYAFVAVVLMLLLFLRSAYDTLMVMLPILFASVVTAGLSAMAGLELNFANIIALPLLVGIGVDSGIHVVHRMRTEPPKDGDPLHTSTSRAVFASALTTMASFGNLAFASHVGMSSMGQLLTLGMLMSLVSVLILLPALLQLGHGK